MTRGQCARTASALTAALLILAAAGGAAAATTVDAVPTTQVAEVGAPFTISATVFNDNRAVSAPLTAHLEIIDPTRSGSVDAEDWVPDLNAPIGRLDPGASADVEWELVPIAGGNFAVYVVVLPETAGTTPGGRVAASAAIPVEVSEVRTLNAGGALPVSVIVPLLLALGVFALRIRARRGERRALGTGDGRVR